MTDAPLHRLNQFIQLSPAEAKAFTDLAVERRRLRRHDVIRAQGDPVHEVYMLVEGWVATCIDSEAGDRQIVKVHLPGDMLGAPSLTLSAAAETLLALNRVTIDVIPSARLGQLFLSSRRLAGAMFLNGLQERIWLMDRLLSVGRTSAAQRLAAFLLSIFDRLRSINGADGVRFHLPLSQGEVANVLGITPVHTNRTFSQLVRMGLISRSGKWITLEDLGGLRELASVPAREFESMPAWLSEVRQRTRGAKTNVPAE
jgi:CRP/FNR family transcriptional regulator, anaerobic regulatory protein